MQTDSLKARLKSSDTFRGWLVDEAESIGDVTDLLRVVPACYIIPTTDSAGANRLASGAIDQKVTQNFAVLAIFKQPERGDLHRIETALRDLLLGFTDREAGIETPVEYAGGATLRIADFLATRRNFRTTYHVRKTGA